MIAVFSLRDAEICNAIRSYEKLEVCRKKKRKDLAVLAKTQHVKYIFLVKLQSSILFLAANCVYIWVNTFSTSGKNKREPH